MVIAIEIAVLCTVFTAIVIPLAIANPGAFASDYPPAIRERCLELGIGESRTTRYTPADIARKAVAMVLFALLGAYLLKRFNGVETFVQGFATAYLIWCAIAWWDALVIDCGIFCHWRRLRIPGTEDLVDAYHDYAFHIRQTCIGMALGLPACALVGLLVALL